MLRLASQNQWFWFSPLRTNIFAMHVTFPLGFLQCKVDGAETVTLSTEYIYIKVKFFLSTIKRGFQRTKVCLL